MPPKKNSVYVYHMGVKNKIKYNQKPAQKKLNKDTLNRYIVHHVTQFWDDTHNSMNSKLFFVIILPENKSE